MEKEVYILIERNIQSLIMPVFFVVIGFLVFLSLFRRPILISRGQEKDRLFLWPLFGIAAFIAALYMLIASIVHSEAYMNVALAYFFAGLVFAFQDWIVDFLLLVVNNMRGKV